MKIFDMHIHARGTKPDPDALLSQMDKAGVFGGCVMSNTPDTSRDGLGTSFEERLNEALGWSRGHEDRIYPVLRIDPYEENAIEKARIAHKRGIAAFKIICSNFYVYEEKPMALLREIAALGHPVIFHTGILWDGEVSSNFNRPLNWEALLEIKGLRFSLAHCSWPWIDECVALYGKFLNSSAHENGTEMFFDLTPGTPEIYRRELLTKLFEIGYNVGDNILYGSDCNASPYRSEWIKKWIDTDTAILDELGVSLEVREKMFSKNLMRFLGKSCEAVEKLAPTTDNSNEWSPINPDVSKTIEKWYKKLPFSSLYDTQFYRALHDIKISDAISIDRYDLGCENGKRNLLSFLYLCEGVSKKYAERGIPENVLLETLNDIVIFTNEWSAVKGELYLGELNWLIRHIRCSIFKLGRLQFAFGNAECDSERHGIKKGDPVLEMHIPKGGKLDRASVLDSVKQAKNFFAKYFPDYKYKCMTCHSWLLDDKLKEVLPEESNIISFGNMFDKIRDDDTNILLRYLFRWDTTDLNVSYAVPNTSLAEKIKKAVMRGEKFHETLGIFKCDDN